jgi:hypothetical protein
MKNKSDNSIKLLSEIISYFAIGSLLFLAIGLKDIDNYLDWLTFSVTLIVTGILFGMTLHFALCFFIPNIKIYKNSKGIGILAPLVFAFALVFFGLGSIVNETSNQKTECKEYIIQDMGESGSRQRAYYIFINNGEKTERLSFGKAFNKMHKTGDNINLCIITGRLGFKYYKIKSKNH